MYDSHKQAEGAGCPRDFVMIFDFAKFSCLVTLAMAQLQGEKYAEFGDLSR
jgi:hypothetical protein